jgi:hypothetical protein
VILDHVDYSPSAYEALSLLRSIAPEARLEGKLERTGQPLRCAVSLLSLDWTEVTSLNS